MYIIYYILNYICILNCMLTTQSLVYPICTPPTPLPSGNQHSVVCFYEFIFICLFFYILHMSDIQFLSFPI